MNVTEDARFAYLKTTVFDLCLNELIFFVDFKSEDRPLHIFGLK